jgi:GDPmannose 4,6-dehydratase
MSKRALVTGINGMDGSHLADFLLEKNYEVFGMERKKDTEDRLNTSHLVGKVTFLKGDLADKDSLVKCIRDSKPDEVYNLASRSLVEDSWDTPENIANTTGVGVLRMLEAIKEYGSDNIRFYQASSSEIFGRMVEDPSTETSPFYPRSPYGVAKQYGHWICRNYRESYGMFNCSGILFNHESERRGKQFVTRKITHGIAKIYLGLNKTLALGNLESIRDWGYAPDYVEGMWSMLQQSEPDDYVLATGVYNSIRHLLDIAFNQIGITDWKDYVIKDEKFSRPAEVDVLRGDASNALNKLGWAPKTSFEEMIRRMVQNDIKLLEREILVNK